MDQISEEDFDKLLNFFPNLKRVAESKEFQEWRKNETDNPLFQAIEVLLILQKAYSDNLPNSFKF